MTSKPVIDDTPVTILGARGFIGSSLANFLKTHRVPVFLPKTLDEFLKDKHERVIYCIGLTADFRQRPIDTMDAHVCVLQTVLKQAEFTSLTYLSSTRVYSGANNTDEFSRLELEVQKLDDLYNISKLAGEALCYHSGRSNIKVVRLSNVVGLRSDRDLFIDQILDEILSTNSLLLKSSLSSSKDYVFIDDVVKALTEISASNFVGCVNLGNGKNTSNAEILNQLLSFFNFDFEVTPNAPEIIFPPIQMDRYSSHFSTKPLEFSIYFPEYIRKFKFKKGIP